VHPKVRHEVRGPATLNGGEQILVPRQQYSRELNIEAMRELESGRSMAEVARMYQLSPRRLEIWKGEWRAKGELAFS
jgi:hypothetical protein